MFDSSYKKPVIYAAILHLIILLLILIHFTSRSGASIAQQAAPKIISAVAIPASAIKAFEQKTLPSVSKPTLAKSIKKQKPLNSLKKVYIPTKTVHHKTHKAKLLAHKKTNKHHRIHHVSAKQLQHKKLAEQKRLKQQAAALQQKLMAEQMQAETKNISQIHQQAVIDAEVDGYKSKIAGAIGHHWLQPGHIKQDLQAKLLVHLGPGGVVLSVTVLQSSGKPVLDRSAIAAVYKTSPLPIPKDPKLFDKFRELRLTVHPSQQTIIMG